MYLITELDETALSCLKGSKEFNLPADTSIDSGCKYSVVRDDDQDLAVFDIRNAPSAIKQMSIYYSNQLVMGGNLTETDLLGKSMTALNVLVSIFRHVLPSLDEGKTTTKIYASNNAAYMVFSIMARNLKEQGDYEVSLYSKWIEISTKGGGEQ